MVSVWIPLVAGVIFMAALSATTATAIYKDITPMERVTCTHDVEDNELDCTRITHSIEKFSVPVG